VDLVGLGLILCFLAGCRFPGSVKPTIKIGVSGPFEGQYREIGYEALTAVRLAVQQRNRQGGIADAYLVEIAALNDFDEAQTALLQAYKMAADPDIMAVLGVWSAKTGPTTRPIYEALGLALVSPQARPFAEGPATGFDADLVQRYQDLSGGSEPGRVALWAYESAERILDAIEAAARANQRPTRKSVRRELARQN
jgi:ABC-type branched-subunit amino acid transport system substrate-binding protein